VDWEFKYGNNLDGYGVNPRNNHALILDVDIKEGKYGLQSLERLISKFGLPKSNFIVRSKSGGRHLYYKYPEGVGDIVGIPFPNFQHIDIRTSNTFVVGPCSLNGKYVMEHGHPSEHHLLVDVGEKVVDLLPKKQQIAAQVIDVNPVTDISISGEIPDVIRMGERDNTIIRLIGSWVRAGFSKKNVIILTQAAIDRCEKSKSDPITIEEYLPKIESTFEKSTFSRPVPEPLQFFIDNAIWVKAIGGVYEIPSRRVYVKDLTSMYAPHVYYIENETASGTKVKEVSAFTAWKKSKRRKEVQGIGYHPVPDTITFDDVQNAEIANLYMPPDFPSIDEVPCPIPDIDKYFEDFCHYLFGKKADFMLDWAAHIVQHPDQKLSIAPVMVSEARGVGKNMFFDIISCLIGKHNAAVFSTDQISSKHNDYILRNHLVLVNESYISAADRWSRKSRNQMIEDIKMLITDYAQSVDPKFITPFMTRSYVNYIFASNNLNAVPIEANDRRFEVLIIDAAPAKKEVYDRLWKIADNSNTGKLLAAYLRQHLMERDIKLVQVGKTASEVDEDKALVIAANRSSAEESLFFAIQNNESVFKNDIITFELFAWYVLEKVDPTISLENIRGLFKTMCKPIYVASQRLNRQLTVDYPALTVKNSTIPAGRGRKGIYTCRRFAYYDDHRDIDSGVLTNAYNINFDATRPVTRAPIAVGSGLELVK
jgi:hypothetical protein